jgi:hypothetical protein
VKIIENDKVALRSDLVDSSVAIGCPSPSTAKITICCLEQTCRRPITLGFSEIAQNSEFAGWSYLEARATPLGWLCDPETLAELDGV